MTSESSSSRVYKPSEKLGSDSVSYSFLVDSQYFRLTDRQLRSEPGNLLNLKAISPSNPNLIRRPNEYIDDRIIIETDINLFRLIHAHLQGFEIFPLPPQGIPLGRRSNSLPELYLSTEATLKNLFRDATDFGLMNLAAKIKQEIANQAKVPKESNSQPIDDESEAAKEFVILDSV